MITKERLDLAMDIGERMLVVGAEIHRVEDTVNRLCHALGAARADCFIITSSIVVTVHSGEYDSLTDTRRITSSSNDFHKLDMLNKLSRRICAGELDDKEIRREIRRVDASPTYAFPIEVLSYALIAASFTVFFGGGAISAIISAVIGAILRFAVLIADRTANNVIFAKFISAATVTVFAFISVRLGLVSQADEIIIGNIMLLIPGLGLTNALRDLFTGDSLAGILRSLEAVLCAIAIAAGYIVVSLVVGGAV